MAMVDVGFPKNWLMNSHIQEGYTRIHMYASLMVVSAKYCWVIAKIIAPEIESPEFWGNHRVDIPPDTKH